MERRRDAAKVNRKVTVPRKGNSYMDGPKLTTVIVGGNISFSSLSKRPMALLFLVTTPGARSGIRLRMLDGLSVVLVSRRFARTLEGTASTRRFLSVVSGTSSRETSVSRRLTSAKGTRDSFGVLTMATYPANVTRACVTTRKVRGTTGTTSYFMGVRAEKDNKTGGILASRRVTSTSYVVITTSARIPVSHFSKGGMVVYRISSKVDGTSRLITRTGSKGIPIFRKGGPTTTSSSAKGGDNNIKRRVCVRLVGNISRVLPLIINNNVLVTVTFLVSKVYMSLGTLPTSRETGFNVVAPMTTMFGRVNKATFKFVLPILTKFVTVTVNSQPTLTINLMNNVVTTDKGSKFLKTLMTKFLTKCVVMLLHGMYSGLPSTLRGVTPMLVCPLVKILLVKLTVVFMVRPVVNKVGANLGGTLANVKSSDGMMLKLILKKVVSVSVNNPFGGTTCMFNATSVTTNGCSVVTTIVITKVIPPYTVTLSALLFGSGFAGRRESTNPAGFVVNLTFVARKTVPFTTSSPLRMLPSYVVNSTVTNKVSVLFKYALVTPRNKVFMFPIIKGTMVCLISLMMKAIVSTMLLKLLGGGMMWDGRRLSRVPGGVVYRGRWGRCGGRSLGS